MSRVELRATSNSRSEKSPASERTLGATENLSLSWPRMLLSCDEMVPEASEASSLPFVAPAM